MAYRLFRKQIIFNKQHFGHYYICVMIIIRRLCLIMWSRTWHYVLTLDLNVLEVDSFIPWEDLSYFWHNNWFGDLNAIMCQQTFFIALCMKNKMINYFNPSLLNCTKIINTNTLCTHTHLLDMFSTKVDNVYGWNKCIVWTKVVFIFMIILLKDAQKNELNKWCKVLMTF